MNCNIWPNRFHALDVSRCIASLSVILWHWQHFGYEGNLLAKDFVRKDQPLFDILELFYLKGAEGVSYFFILSGFIFFWLYRDSIKDKATNALKFFTLRFSRLYPLHLATLLVVALLQLLHISSKGSSFVYPFNDVYHFILNLGFASHWGFESGHSFNAPVWSVSIEVLLYAFFFIVAFLKQGSLLFTIVVSVISLVFFEITGNRIFGGLSLFFLGGVVFHLTQFISTNRPVLRFPVFLITGIAWFAVILNFYVINIGSLVIGCGLAGKFFLSIYCDYILFPFTICSIALIEIRRGSFLEPISWIGDITYSSYLLHFPLQLAFALLVSYGAIQPDFYLSQFYFALFFMLLIPFSYLTYIKFERPLQKVIRNKILKD